MRKEKNSETKGYDLENSSLYTPKAALSRYFGNFIRIEQTLHFLRSKR